MSRRLPTVPTSPTVRLAIVVAFAAIALAGCAATAPQTEAGPSVSAPGGGCAEVTTVVDFGALDAPSIHACAAAGAAMEAFDEAGVSTEGTADYGDQVVCRVDDLPAPDVETCATLPTGAYWALWVKADPTADWEYAQEGLATLQLSAGQSVGLVYTEGTDSVPPSD